MIRGVKFSAVILSALIISSCATDRYRVGRKDDLACKIPETRYDYARNNQIRALRSGSRKVAGNRYNKARNNIYKSYSTKKIVSKNRKVIRTVQNNSKTGIYGLLTCSGIDEQALYQQLMNSAVLALYNYDPGKILLPAKTFGQPNDIISNPAMEDILLPANTVNANSGYANFTLPGKLTENIVPKNFSNETLESDRIGEKSDRPQKIPFRKREAFILMLALFAGLIPYATLKANPNLAADISYRAAMNPWKTRFMFAGIQFGLMAGGVMLGDKLADNGLHFSKLSRDLLLAVFLTSSALYPVRHTSVKLFRHSYLRQKAFDLAVAISGFMLMVNVGNDPELRASLFNKINLKDYELQNVNMVNDNNQRSNLLMYFQNDKHLQNEQTILQEEKKIRNKKIGLTVLVSLGILALALLVTGAACALACEDMVGLAALVGVGGGVLVIALAIKGIRSIWRPKPKNRIKPADNAETVFPAGTYRI
ncbi:MAG: hypothetical protein JXN62_04700 [Bacteroidales bacterium]|nr:hypothetical protein [Bacteroidales bacterium]